MQNSYFSYLLFAFSYICQHIGFAFIATTLVVILRQQGASLMELGYLKLIIVPYSLRFLWAPLVEYLGFSDKGHFRQWLLPIQFCIALSWLFISFVQPMTQLPLLFGLLLISVILIGTQDLALDGLACSAFEEKARLTINTIQIASGMMGNLIGGGLVILYPHLGWQNSLLILAGFSLLPCLLVWNYQEKVSPLPQSTKMMQSWKILFTFWQGKWQWFLMLAFYSLGFSGGFAILSPALVDRGWTLSEIGLLMNYGVIIGLIAVVIIIPINRRLSRQVSSRLFTFVQLISLFALLPLASGNPSPFWAYIAVTACYLSFAPMFTTNSSTMMDIASKQTTPTITYTVQIAVAMLFSVLAKVFCLQLAENFGYVSVVIVCIISTLVTLLFISSTITKMIKKPEF
ncbi:MFS transporter [Rodentibacter genomosp. 2]|uniref:MFS transporter n=1 Tax=Rodentibacter genomosp. 2 TaxID=1908266 RepID=A0A1V3JA67_9PAST|nr:MFS transporter [Rodentibacter genomosp. 2]OOF53068.1 hypothetical protein BKK55_11790 [Rodentibacter genomosp. 2]OOF56244.1 hypothetical protein BKK56_04505 [Rodentibacter genomosp. 2]